MSIPISSIIIEAKSCECQFEIDMKYNEYDSQFNHKINSPRIFKKGKLVKICNYHEMEARRKLERNIKKNYDKQTYEEIKKYLSQLGNEIPILDL